MLPGSSVVSTHDVVKAGHQFLMNILWRVEQVIGLGMGTADQNSVLICRQNDQLVRATLRQGDRLDQRCLKDLAGARFVPEKVYGFIDHAIEVPTIRNLCDCDKFRLQEEMTSLASESRAKIRGLRVGRPRRIDAGLWN